MEKKEKAISYSHILKYMSVFGGVQCLSILISVVRNKLVAVLLGPNGVGLISLFNSTIKLISDSTNLGLSMSAVKTISEHFDSGNSEKVAYMVRLIRVWCLFTGLLGMFVCLVLSPLLDSWTFEWGDHTLHFVLLSPVIAMMAVTGGELAILKATRKLKQVAWISFLGVVGTLVLTVPIYYFCGEAGIVPSLVVVALLQMMLPVIYSYRYFPLNLSMSKGLYDDGLGMVKLGVAFVFAGIMGSGVDFAIRSYLNTNGSLGIVGLYNAGYMMTMVYAGMVFSAMETDYFPRLSAINSIGEELNETVNRQIEVSLILVSPLLAFFMIGLPVIIPLLYTSEFLPLTGMVQIAILSMFIRAVALPIAYIPLSKGDSASYLLMEAGYDVVLLGAVIWLYDAFGLTGAGAAITFAALFDMGMLMIYMHYKYNYVMSRQVVKYIVLFFSMGITAFLITFLENRNVYWIIGFVFVLISSGISLNILRRKTGLWNKLKSKLIAR